MSRNVRQLKEKKKLRYRIVHASTNKPSNILEVMMNNVEEEEEDVKLAKTGSMLSWCETKYMQIEEKKHTQTQMFPCEARKQARAY